MASGSGGNRPAAGPQVVYRDPTEIKTASKPVPQPAAPVISSLLEAVISQTEFAEPEKLGTLASFLAADSKNESLRIWFGPAIERKLQLDRDAILRQLGRDIAALDELLNEQLNVILHNPKFQDLESAWRGLYFLTEQAEEAKELLDEEGSDSKIKIRMLNVSKKELYRDLERAVEFDQNQIFKKVYEEEFGTAGGEPFGVLIGDYRMTNHVEDIDLIQRMSEVAAASFAPFVTGVAPEFFGLETYAQLEQSLNLPATFNQLEYLKWRAFRDREEARFVGLTLPRVLMRTPYEDDGSHHHQFRFKEDVDGPDRSKYLWGNAAYSFGAVLIRAYAESGWFAEIRGAERDTPGGGMVAGLPVHSFSTDRLGVALKTSTEVSVNEFQEKELTNLGFIPLCPCKDTEYSVFYSNPSTQKPKGYDDPVATANARLSAMMQYMLCCSRFSHNLKVLCRNKIGAVYTESELENYLNRWLTTYVAADERATRSIKARYPLREGQVQVREVPSKPGTYKIIMHLLPHFQLDDLTATLRLVTEFSPQSAKQ